MLPGNQWYAAKMFIQINFVTIQGDLLDITSHSVHYFDVLCVYCYLFVIDCHIQIKMSHRLSYSLNVYLPKPTIECCRKSFKYVGGKIGSDLPNNIQNVPSVEAFKYACKKLYFKYRNTH